MSATGIQHLQPILLKGGWGDEIASCKTFEELPENAQKYISFIEKYIVAGADFYCIKLTDCVEMVYRKCCKSVKTLSIF